MFIIEYNKTEKLDRMSLTRWA